jgi:hypothetical protein
MIDIYREEICNQAFKDNLNYINILPKDSFISKCLKSIEESIYMYQTQKISITQESIDYLYSLYNSHNNVSSIAKDINHWRDYRIELLHTHDE